MVLRANPEESADLATRSVQAQNLKDSIWHSGPQFLYHHGSSVNETIGSDASLPTEDDPEVRPLVKSGYTGSAKQIPKNQLFFQVHTVGGSYEGTCTTDLACPVAPTKDI